MLDSRDHVSRPCIMWNEGRSAVDCAELEQKADFRGIGGNLVMPGFTAPKRLRVAKHESRLFNKVTKALLPKEYVRLWPAGECAPDLSEASCTPWMDVAARDWSETHPAACRHDRSHMPSLREGRAVSGKLPAPGFSPRVSVAGGAGDNAAAACGMGIVQDSAFLSLGASGDVLVRRAAFAHTRKWRFTPFVMRRERWHQLGVILSAACCFDWLAMLASTTAAVSPSGH